LKSAMVREGNHLIADHQAKKAEEYTR